MDPYRALNLGSLLGGGTRLGSYLGSQRLSGLSALI